MKEVLGKLSMGEECRKIKMKINIFLLLKIEKFKIIIGSSNHKLGW